VTILTIDEEGKMKKKKSLRYALSCLALIILVFPIVSSAADMEILSRVDISTERRHAWNPWVEYNPDKDEFFVIWNSTGKLRDDCSPDDDYDCVKSFQSIEAARIAPSGKVLENLVIIPPKGPKDDVSWIAMPRIAYNTSRQEYLALYNLSTDTCVQCHDRNTETGEVSPADPGKCILCHPGDGPGLCNLLSFHDPGNAADCLTCHIDCVEGEPPLPPASHPENCVECHVVDGPGGIHSRPGHLVWAIDLFTMRLDSDGNVLTQPAQLYETPASSGHPVLVFNSKRKQYLIGTADRFHSDEYDNVGFIVDEDATVLKGPFFFGEGNGDWTHVLYYAAYNPLDDTYFIPWEDFRHATGAWYFGPNDIYAALLNGDGTTRADIPVIEDSTEGEYEQWYPCVTYNPDKNEFFVAWFDETPSLVEDGGIVGRLFNAEGSFKGEPSVLVDTTGSQGDVAMVYVQKHKRYFIVYQSTQNFVQSPDDPPWYFENDIYARWVDEDGLPLGEEIPIYLGEGDQTMPQVSYSPHSDRIFVTWWDTHAPDDFDPLPGETGQFAEISSVVMGNLGRGNLYGVVYGTPQLCAVEEIYGEDSSEVALLRNARDTLLNKTPEGKALIELYYQWSPAIAKALQEDGVVKEELKKMIDSILPFLGGAVH
jgi:hypothetical protein